ncbi:putative THO complex, subunit 5 protein [Septoria linicola]|nr:putative THO complex, subunit 5 protein [Septoria linicola]
MSSADALITDPVLISVLSAAKETRAQCNSILDFIAQNGSASYEDMRLLTEQKTLSSRLAILRGLNRKAILGVRATKQETTEARQEIDELHLQLQNLYYEQRHLRGEIRGCEEYNHKYEHLGMVQVEDFLAKHPEYSVASDHDLTVARIEDEHAARKELESRRQELEKRKEALMKKNAAEKEQLAALDDSLEKWLVGGQEKPTTLFDARQKKVAEEDAKK